MEFDQLRKIVAGYASEGAQRAKFESRVLDLGAGLFSAFFVRRGGYSVIRLTDADDPTVGTFVQIAGAGGCDVPNQPELYEAIMDRHISVDWGGPFARTWPDGAVVFGTQMTLPSSVLASETAKAFGFLFEMVGVFADIARSIALELVPRFGGRVLAGDDRRDDNELLVALIGPPPASEPTATP